MRDPGHWKVDLIHNQPDDLLVYNPNPQDPTQGLFVSIRGKELQAGTFSGAVPCIGDACFVAKTTRTAENPLELACGVLGMSFLLALTLGTSPYCTNPGTLPATILAA